MNRKRKRITLIVLLLAITALAIPIGLKYFPFTKVVKMPSAPEAEYGESVTTRTLPPHALWYDFEVPAGKPVPDGFYKGKAHSGQYSVKAFGQNSFSNAVERTAAEIGTGNLKSASISAWIYVFPTQKEVKGSLVLTASNELGVNVLWQGIGVREPEVPKGAWFKVSGQFDLSSVVFKPGYKIQIYFWNTSSTDILVDDYYAVFGNTPERRGDSTRVDLTRPEGFVPRFNFPPFPVSFLVKEEPGVSMNPHELKPDDLTVAGDFFKTGSDGLFAINQAGKVVAFIFCPANRTFQPVNISNPAAATVCGRIRNLYVLKSPVNKPDRVVMVAEKGWLLASLTGIEQPCQSNVTRKTTLTILSRMDETINALACGDFNGDGRQEILTVSDGGTWQLFRTESESERSMTWKRLNKTGLNPVSLWNKAEFRCSLTAGRFLPGTGHDVVLTVADPSDDAGSVYSIFDFDPVSLNWNPVFPRSQQYLGLTKGIDTLRPIDRFFILKSGSGYRVFRYNRDWRFDLKEIRFSDSAFTILSNIDFRGYEKGMNPKFYENLNLIPLNPGITGAVAFLINGSVARERHYETLLPDFIQLYLIEPKGTR